MREKVQQGQPVIIRRSMTDIFVYVIGFLQLKYYIHRYLACARLCNYQRNILIEGIVYLCNG